MSSNAVKVAIGAAVAVLLIILLTRSDDEADSYGAKPPKVDSQAVDAVRQRLDQLRNSRDSDAHHEEHGSKANVKVDSAVAGTPSGLQRRFGQPVPAGPVVNVERAPDKMPPAPHGGNVTGTAGLRDMGIDDIPTLKKMATDEGDVEKRLEAVTMLGATEEPEVVPVLGQALADEDPEVRLAAIQALADFTGDAPFDLLGKAALEDPDADNRYEALEALSDLEDDRIQVYAKQALQDPDEDVRGLAESILGLDDAPEGQGEGQADGKMAN